LNDRFVYQTDSLPTAAYLVTQAFPYELVEERPGHFAWRFEGGADLKGAMARDAAGEAEANVKEFYATWVRLRKEMFARSRP